MKISKYMKNSYDMKLHYVISMLLACILASSISISAQPKNPYYEKGYKADLQLGMTPAKNYVIANWALTSSHGYCFGNGLFVGGGTGFYLNERGLDGKKCRLLLPVYGEVTYSFMNRLASPLIGVRGGALSDYTVRGSGFFVRPYIGANIWRISVTLGVELLSMGYRDISYTKVGDGFDINGPTGFQIGDFGVHIGISYNF